MRRNRRASRFRCPKARSPAITAASSLAGRRRPTHISAPVVRSAAASYPVTLRIATAYGNSRPCSVSETSPLGGRFWSKETHNSYLRLLVNAGSAPNATAFPWRMARALLSSDDELVDVKIFILKSRRWLVEEVRFGSSPIGSGIDLPLRGDLQVIREVKPITRNDAYKAQLRAFNSPISGWCSRACV